MEILSILVLIRAISALYAPIMDCDETFNYWEPLHYLLYGRGFQTWEYSPEFGLRTYAYVIIHGVLGLPSFMYQGYSESGRKEILFFLIRAGIGAICALGEYRLFKAVKAKYGNQVAYLMTLFLIVNSGMFHSSVAFLPSSTCMLAVLHGYAYWIQDRHIPGLFCGAFAVLMCWPFVALMFIPMGFDALLKAGFFKVLAAGVGSVACFIGIPCVIDSKLYGKPIFAILNLVLYNVLGQGGDGQGANLYGTEPWHFYVQNLVLNFNFIFILAAAAPVVVLLFYSAHAKGAASKMDTMVYLFPAMSTFALFTSMDHKEERFLSMIYPILCFAAALSVVQLYQWIGRFKQPVFVVVRHLVTVGIALVVIVTVALCMSRSFGLYRNFRAPFRVYHQIQQLTTNLGQEVKVCVGKEWYRFPSNFFVPPYANVYWVRAAFDGHLPRHYSPWPGASIVHPYFNDRNQGDPEAFLDVHQCNYAIDLEVGDDFGDIGRWDENKWQAIFCTSFLDSDASRPLIRSFYIPMYSERVNTYARYCLLKKV